jgi:hypothetical protein
MRPHDDPTEDLTPEQRFVQIAALLAAGLRRLHPRTALSAPFPQPEAAKNLPENARNCLELSTKTRLSGQAG